MGKVLRPVREADSSKECNYVTTYLQVMSAMKSFENYSLEELRYNDYALKGARGSVLTTTYSSVVSIPRIGKCVDDASLSISSKSNTIHAAYCTSESCKLAFVLSRESKNQDTFVFSSNMNHCLNNLTGLFTTTLSVDHSFSFICVPSFSKATSRKVKNVTVVG
ncbi:uncharacterized protein LOC127850134 [Dreissena polymorpha]|uniref:Uncharacterized protein n=1 Tax=Dreissena polymorpha TaxID=45954 RepID=A0A9D4HUT8_DREPO|nr:uncharacterized protein LOC127850134 [Dreissena polymorpha]KAH3733584.1 hypothetical protein DPMN_040015 [Dreissena polymorpha]